MTYVDVDKVGRLVLPKEIRERYGIFRGGRLELVDTGDGMLLTPQIVATAVTHLANGFPVLKTPANESEPASSGAMDDTDLSELIASSRAERDARNLNSVSETE
jgi:AbrB family looped-hinge helix DNA binding protein